MIKLNQENKKYWQKYKTGEIPSVPNLPPTTLLDNIHGPILDIGTGDGALAEQLAVQGHEVEAIDLAENIVRANMTRNSKVRYSLQDITQGTNFDGAYFDLAIFRFTLTNIHKESWRELGVEINRILKPTGKVWILEPLVSESYRRRYLLASKFIDEPHCVYVFKDKELAEKINTEAKLKQALANDLVSRIVKHYTIDELKSIFNTLKLNDHRVIEIISPSGFIIKTFEGVFSK
ncbi:MAG: class I SAM-dependent methyltransferase [Candidatus Shapirobacteria bacterium]|jgi:ubiquinone/menaquinone biosynthesis C-methylase UbiE